MVEIWWRNGGEMTGERNGGGGGGTVRAEQ